MRPRTALAILFILTLFHLWPLAAAPWRLSLNHADAQYNAWAMAWIDHALVSDPIHLFDGNIFAPERQTLVYSDPLIVPALMGAPIRMLGGSPVLEFNVVTIAGFALTAFSGFLLVQRWTGSASAGLVSGALIAFNVHLLTRVAHIAASHLWGVPLAIYVADLMIERPAVRTGVALAAVVAASAATSLYTLALVGLVIAITCAAALMSSQRRAIVAVTIAAVAGFVAATPVLLPYLRFASTGASRPLEVVAQFAATPGGYLVTPGLIHAFWGTKLFDGNTVNVMFAGVTALLLAIVGFTTRKFDRRTITLVMLIAVGILLSLGPSTPIYRWLYSWFLPLRGLRAAARFGYLYLTAIAIAAGFGLAWLMRVVDARSSRRAATTVAAAALVIVTAEAWQGPITAAPFTRVPPIYTELRELRDPVLLVEVPFFPPDMMFENGEYTLNATAHWRPVMNGNSGFTPDSYRRRADSFWFFPEDWAIESIRREGATHVMVHLEKFGGEAAAVQAALLKRSDLRLVSTDALGHQLYAVVR